MFFFTLLRVGEAIAEVKEEGKDGGEAPGGSSGSATITIISVVGSVLLVINLVLLYCYVKRRAAKHLFGKPGTPHHAPNLVLVF